MVRLGLIKSYALGGATALIYYFEPIQTQDIDIFVLLADDKSTLVNLSPIYSFLEEKGARADKEYILISGVPVQFLVPYNVLIEEAVKYSVPVKFREVEIKIPPVEYLMAIMVQTGRGKDKARLEEIFKLPNLFDQILFEKILSKFNLSSKWESIQKWFETV
jgi:hypothetical protein